MKFTCDYDVLTQGIASVSVVVDESNMNANLKGIIFQFKGDGSVTLIGAVPQVMLFKNTLDKEAYYVEFTETEKKNMESNPLYLQFKSKDLNDMLSTYKGTRRTVVESVSFETTEGASVICKVLERDKDEDGNVVEGTERISRWKCNSLPLNNSQINEVSLKAPEVELQTITSQVISLYTKNLLPIVQSDGADLFSYISFVEDYAICFNKGFSVFMKNNQPVFKDIFKNLRLSYKVASFIDKVLLVNEELLIAKTDTHIYFKAESCEAFVRYDVKMPLYDHILKSFTKDTAIVVDRIYLKDILKRLSLAPEDIRVSFDIEGETVHLSNKMFDQDLSILQTKNIGVLENISFRLKPDKLRDAIIGSDTIFQEELRIYFTVVAENKLAITLTDSTASWFSVLQVGIKSNL